MEVKCGLCAGEGFGDEAKPITASDCYSTTPVDLCQCARCTSFRENNRRNSYVGMTHNDLMHLVKSGGEKAAGRASRGVIKDLAHGTFVEVPNHRDHLNEWLCNELANLSRNVAGLTGVAKQLADRSNVGVTAQTQNDVNISLERNAVYRVDANGIVSRWTTFDGPITREELTNALCDYFDNHSLSRSNFPVECNGLLRVLRAFAAERGIDLNAPCENGIPAG